MYLLNGEDFYSYLIFSVNVLLLVVNNSSSLLEVLSDSLQTLMMISCLISHWQRKHPQNWCMRFVCEIGSITEEESIVCSKVILELVFSL